MVTDEEIDLKQQEQQTLQLLKEGDSLFVDEEFEAASKAYTSCLNASTASSTPSSNNNDQILSSVMTAFSHRSAANLKLMNYANALHDAKCGIDLYNKQTVEESSISNNNDRKKQLEMCYTRVGIASFELKKFKDAISAFKEANDWFIRNNNNSSRNKEYYELWIAKSENSLSNINIRSKATQPPSVPKYQYYQSDTMMTITILESGVKSENLKVDFSLDKLTVILTKQGVDLTVMHGTLYDAVDVSKCKVKFMDEKVLIKLRKRDVYNWNELFGNGARSTEADDDDDNDDNDKNRTTNDDNTPVVKEAPKAIESKSKVAAIARPYSSDKDWDALDRDLRKEEENEKPVGDDALNKLFQGIYGKASDETKRAMVKSFQTSGGTVLSTNWDEVSKADYEKERQAPKGMEWKNWEGNKLPQKED